MTVTEILDALIKSLEGRRRENDDKAVYFWVDELEINVVQLLSQAKRGGNSSAAER